MRKICVKKNEFHGRILEDEATEVFDGESCIIVAAQTSGGINVG